MATGNVYCLGVDYRIEQHCLKTNRWIRKTYTLRDDQCKGVHDILKKIEPECDCLFRITNECDLTTFYSRNAWTNKMIFIDS